MSEFTFQATNEELKKVSGGNGVPVLLVGTSVQKGFEQGALDALLDNAHYPKAGVVPARKQAPPPPPPSAGEEPAPSPAAAPAPSK